MVDYVAMFTIIFAFAMPSTTLVMGWLVFGAIGTVAVGYAKMKEEWPCAVLGFSLMFYPYVFPSGIGFWVVGTILSILFFMPKRVLGF
jgi:hypothetical protein